MQLASSDFEILGAEESVGTTSDVPSANVLGHPASGVLLTLFDGRPRHLTVTGPKLHYPWPLSGDHRKANPLGEMRGQGNGGGSGFDVEGGAV